MKKVIGIMLTALIFTGCGKKGPLIPPEALVPAAAQNFHVQQKGADFRITWSAPTKEQSGRPLRDLAGFRLLRRDLAGDGSDCAACADSWKVLSAIDLELPGETKQSGSTFIHVDRGVPQGRTCQYQLLTLSRSGGSSSPATSPLLRMLPAVTAPTIKATVLPASIKIAFTYTAPADAQLLGFNIYRRLNSSASALLPLNNAPITQAVWEDQQVQFGQTYRYSATATFAIAGETVESLPSAEEELLFSQPELR